MGTRVQSHPIIRHLYIHFPFCLGKCAYCSFFSVPFDNNSFAVYFAGLRLELSRTVQRFDLQIDTLYLGGGTPALWPLEDIRELFSRFDLSHTKEVTLEANPATVTRECAKVWRSLGINRISLGAQSFVESELRFLGRRHHVSQTRQAMDILREAGFDNLSLDWIYGLPGQSEADLYKTAESLLDLAPEHISTYCLSIERGTRFSREHVQPATDDEAARAYMYICETLAASGFDHYELSNFARPGFQARHNLAYWTGAEYLGLGPGASGFVSGYRYRHPARIESYFLRMERAGLHVGRDRINDAEAEYLMLRLRLTKGFSLNEYANLFGIAFADRHGDSLRRMSELGMVEIAEGFLRLTPKAYFVSNSVIVELMD